MKKLLILAVIAMSSTAMFAEEKVLWQTGMEGLDGTDGTVPGEYQTGLIVSPETFDGIEAGTKLNIDISSTTWAQVYVKNYSGFQIYPSIDLNVGQNISVVLTNFQLNQIADGGLRIDASAGLAITKVAVETDVYTGNFSNALWIGQQAFTADWGGNPVQICPLEAKEVKSGDTLSVYYTKTDDYYSLMVNYVNADGSQTDCSHAWTYGDGMASFIVEEDFANALTENNKGFVVKGASINVNQIDLVNNQSDTSVKNIFQNEMPERADVYDITGLLLHKDADVKDIRTQLPAGIYIIGAKKVLIR